MTDLPSNAEKEIPKPKRFKWLKRIGSVFLILFLGVIAFHIGWIIHTNHQLEAAIETARTNGVPVYVEDLNLPDPLDYDDASIHWEAAVMVLPSPVATSLTTITTNSPTKLRIKDQIDDNTLLEYTLSDAIYNDKIDLFVTQCKPLLDEAALASQFTERNPLSIPVGPALLSYWSSDNSGWRQLAKILNGIARYKAMNGDTQDAMKMLDYCFALTKHHYQRRGITFDYTIGASIDGLACRTIEHILPYLSKEQLRSADAEGRTAFDRTVEFLQVESFRDESFRAGTVYECQGSLAWLDAGKDGTILFCDGYSMPTNQLNMLHKAINLALLPIATKQAALEIRCYEEIQKAVDRKDWRVTRELGQWQNKPFQDYLQFSSSAAPVIEQFGGPSPRMGRVPYANRALRHLTIVALAIRLYELDHGQLPPTLEALSPEYLEQLPRDPYSLNQDTFRYVPIAEFPMLYSVGENSKDDGGIRDSAREYDDLAFYLHGRPPKPEEDEEY